ncbi:MAG: LON peptidase substrate-binding domain-containing protein, partial [Lachnospiraceae bacterium]|nr:LON peptidase substrate-binding domain-containing protein [Lachnospiraceae bacterium]
MSMTRTIPALVLKEMVIMPGNIINFDINRPQALDKLEEVMSTDQMVFVITQKEGIDPTVLDGRFFEVGVISKIR